MIALTNGRIDFEKDYIYGKQFLVSLQSAAVGGTIMKRIARLVMLGPSKVQRLCRHS